MRLKSPIITDLRAQADLARRVRHGVIETRDGRFYALRGRRLPKLVSLAEVLFANRLARLRGRGDRCLLYFDQPRSAPNYLTLKYIVSTAGASFATFRMAALALDQVAALKRSDALVCEVSNARISHRLLTRWGWQRHLTGRWRRHYIKRFYGVYPEHALPACQHAG